jgi:hypothetical protein
MEAFYYTEPPLRSTAPPDMIISIVVDSFYYMPSFAEVIAAYGQPSHALAIGRSTDFAVVYLEHGFMLDFELRIEQLSMGQLAPETLQLTGVRFFVPTLAGFDAAAPTFYDQELTQFSALLVPWVGPKAFSYYCRPAQPGPAARC